ncbi:MAG: sulfite exporter TauE/SafE family protein [Rhodobacteraceae bacterium]|nr:sulfite exporter TauE/SafE family protein [Paracoccaceae bacterium]
MSALFSEISTLALVLALVVTAMAGLIKGMTGFGMPMIMISGLSTVLPPEIALAALIMPTLASNGMQALRLGWRAAWQVVVRFKVYIAVLLVMLVFSAQLVPHIPRALLFLIIGCPISAFAVLMLSGWTAPRPKRPQLAEAIIGGFSGFIGGMSGVWGPPTVAYLTAIELPKREHVQAQGVIYGLGAVVLLAAHVQSGVIRAQTLPLSLLMIIPAVIGMALGQKVQDRIDQKVFKRLTMVVLLVAGLNLVRRGLGW